MENDAYQLFELLRNGDPTTITHGGSTYTLQFMGRPWGSDNYLSVVNRRGQEKRFGWGWSSEQVWRALDHLEAGWDSPQMPPYRAYNAEAEERGGRMY